MRLDKFAGTAGAGVEFGFSRIRFISFTTTSCRSRRSGRSQTDFRAR